MFRKVEKNFLCFERFFNKTLKKYNVSKCNFLQYNNEKKDNNIIQNCFKKYSGKKLN